MRTTFAVLCVVLAAAAAGSAQQVYAFYHDCSGGQGLEVNLISTMPSATEYTLAVYDAWGEVLWADSGTLGPYEAAFYRLGEAISSDQFNWGVAVVRSDERLIIGLEYTYDDQLVSVDTVYKPVPELTPGEPFWAGAYYTQAAAASTGLVVMNPWGEQVYCSLSVYGQDGETLHEEDLTLGPHESEYIDLEDLLGHGPYLWGLVDVEMAGRAVLLAVEYYGRGASGLEIDNICEFYF